MNLTKQYLGALYLAAASSIWGGLFVVVRIAVPVIPPVPLVCLRYFVASITLFLMVYLAKIPWRVAKEDRTLFLKIALIGYTLSIVTQEYGTSLSSAQAGSVITSATPAFMVIFAAIILKEKLTARKIFSILMATAGVWLIAGTGDMGEDFALGSVSLIVAAITWALMSVYLKLLPEKYSPVIVNFYSAVISFGCLLPFNFTALKNLPWDVIFSDASIWGSVAYMGIISTSFAFLLWNKGVVMVDTAVSGLFFFFQPLVGSFLGCVILGEPLTVNFWLGAMLIFGGVFLVIKKADETKPKAG
jgi:drug/metabolite transporter (DMT)-like permease